MVRYTTVYVVVVSEEFIVIITECIGKYFWALIGSAIFLSITIPPTLWARQYADKQAAQKLIDDPKLLEESGIKREHLPSGVAKQLEKLEKKQIPKKS